MYVINVSILFLNNCRESKILILLFLYWNLFCRYMYCSYIIISVDDLIKELLLIFEVINLEKKCYDWIILVLCKLYF